MTHVVTAYLKFQPGASLAFGSSNLEKPYLGLQCDMS